MEIAGLPGAELIETGIVDLGRRAETVPSLLVSIGAPRLRLLGLTQPDPLPDAERRLYALLAAGGSDSAHSRFNGLVRTLVSFERAAALRRRAA